MWANQPQGVMLEHNNCLILHLILLYSYPVLQAEYIAAQKLSGNSPQPALSELPLA